jgi:hypothetical protein
LTRTRVLFSRFRRVDSARNSVFGSRLLINIFCGVLARTYNENTGQRQRGKKKRKEMTKEKGKERKRKQI